MIRVALLLLAFGCRSDPADRLYTPIDCPEGSADCDGLLSTGCESPASEANCCGQACEPGQRCVGGRAGCR